MPSGAHWPVLARQPSCVQAASNPAGQLTTDPGRILHWNGGAEVSQCSLPLQWLPSSLAAQSAVVVQLQGNCGPGAQAPA